MQKQAAHKSDEEMLEFALKSRFSEKTYLMAMETIKKEIQN